MTNAPTPLGGYERDRLAEIIDRLRTERDNLAAENERLRRELERVADDLEEFDRWDAGQAGVASFAEYVRHPGRIAARLRQALAGQATQPAVEAVEPRTGGDGSTGHNEADGTHRGSQGAA